MRSNLGAEPLGGTTGMGGPTDAAALRGTSIITLKRGTWKNAAGSSRENFAASRAATNSDGGFRYDQPIFSHPTRALVIRRGNNLAYNIAIAVDLALRAVSPSECLKWRPRDSDHRSGARDGQLC